MEAVPSSASVEATVKAMLIRERMPWPRNAGMTCNASPAGKIRPCSQFVAIEEPVDLCDLHRTLSVPSVGRKGKEHLDR